MTEAEQLAEARATIEMLRADINQLNEQLVEARIRAINTNKDAPSPSIPVDSSPGR